jgi:hypothetical protein
VRHLSPSRESSRRDVLRIATGPAATVLAGEGSVSTARGNTPSADSPKRALRIAHLTDSPGTSPAVKLGSDAPVCLLLEAQPEIIRPVVTADQA